MTIDQLRVCFWVLLVFSIGSFSLWFVSFEPPAYVQFETPDSNGVSVVFVDSWHCVPVYEEGVNYRFDCKKEKLWWKK